MCLYMYIKMKMCSYVPWIFIFYNLRISCILTLFPLLPPFPLTCPVSCSLSELHDTFIQYMVLCYLNFYFQNQPTIQVWIGKVLSSAYRTKHYNYIWECKSFKINPMQVAEFLQTSSKPFQIRHLILVFLNTK